MSAETELPGSTQEPDEEPQNDETVLRAKYADFCSAQITEVFLSLSDERIYEIVEEEARAQELDPGKLGFRAMVRLATKHLRESVPLPDFETWRRDYEASPERYERYLLGLWRHLTRTEAGDAS
ncbi:MAG: hypothetical protein R3266_10045 [Gemmatimonadota bacterium]|nr:hypothetical protein [Gemmatimonadota bacterium]